MAQSYNWQNATDNLLPFQDFLWQLQSDKPQEIYFRNGGGNLNIKIIQATPKDIYQAITFGNSTGSWNAGAINSTDNPRVIINHPMKEFFNTGILSDITDMG